MITNPPKPQALQALVQFLKPIFHFTSEALEYLNTILVSVDYEQHEFVIKPHHVCDHAYFLWKGTMGWYTLGNDEINANVLSIEHSAVLLTDFFEQTIHNKYFVQALEPCEVLALSYPNQLKLLERFPESKDLLNRLLVEEIKRERIYVQVMRNRNGEERLDYLYELIGNKIYSLDPHFLSSFINVKRRRFEMLLKEKRATAGKRF